ncbi:MAG: hypothetical protein ACJAST_004146, partial [Halopseudomonas sp.]
YTTVKPNLKRAPEDGFWTAGLGTALDRTPG